MDRFEQKTIQGIIYADQELRRIAYKSRQAQKQLREAQAAAEEEREKRRPEELKAFWERMGLPHLYENPAERERKAARLRLLATPAAEAWIAEHPEDFNLDTAPTESAALRLMRVERTRLKAARERLKGMGIK